MARSNNKGQIMPFMVLIIAILLIAIAATMLIGEAGFMRLRLANVADAGLISATSAFCRSMNQIVQLGQSLEVNQTGLAVHLLTMKQKCMCPHGPKMWGWSLVGGPYADGFFINTMVTNGKIVEQIDKLSKDMAKDLRVGLYDTSFGGGLIDEPKPFLDTGDFDWNPDAPDPYDPALDCNNNSAANPAKCDEVKYDDKGRITALNYTRYLRRDGRLTEQLRKFKKGEDPYTAAGGTGWYMHPVISYVFNRKKTQYLNYPGRVTNEPDPNSNYKNYLRAELLNVPTDVGVSYKFRPLLYFWLMPVWTPPPTPKCHCVPSPLPIPNPWAGIFPISAGDSNFGLSLEKSVYLEDFPFFGRRVTLQHKSRVQLGGSTRRGYDFRMTE